MTWVEDECVECGMFVTYGLYYSEHEHEDTEIVVSAKCGYCVNGTTYEEEQEEKKMEEMKIREFVKDCIEQGLQNALESKIGKIEDIEIYLRMAIETTIEMYNLVEDNNEAKEGYARAMYILTSGMM